MMKKFSNRGIIAISTLLVTVILVILIGALLGSLRYESQVVMGYNKSTEALYIAEAGIADATAQLTRDNAWFETAPLEVAFPEGDAKYTIVFDDDGVVEPHESVNNLLSPNPVDGPRGPETVPARTADIVVVAEAGGRTLRYEALISRGFTEPVSVPLLTSGYIRMTGSVDISGIESLTNPIPVDAGIHSNLPGNRPQVISWEGNGLEAYISGEVSTTSSHPNAISSTGGNFNASDVNTGQASMRFPTVDIETALAYGREAPSMMLAPPGATTVVSGGDRSFAGGVINGDLVLDGVNLYVAGNLEVNGTIKGSGSIYVNGDTSFRGDVELNRTDNQKLALFSKGNVELEGFRGTQFLDSIATGNPQFAKWNSDAKWAHEQMKGIISTPGSYLSPSGWGNNNGNLFDQYRRVLGEDSSNVPIDRDSNTLEQMASFLETTYPGNESAEFLVKRLRDTRAIYQNKLESGLSEAQILSNYELDSGDIRGLIDVLNDGNFPSHSAKGSSAIALQNFNRLGTSYFQGMIYTNGAVYASNEVEIVGALMAEKNDHSPIDPWTINGETLNPGDVFLTRGSSIVYNQDLVEDPFSGSATGPVVVVAWLGK